MKCRSLLKSLLQLPYFIACLPYEIRWRRFAIKLVLFMNPLLRTPACHWTKYNTLRFCVFLPTLLTCALDSEFFSSTLPRHRCSVFYYHLGVVDFVRSPCGGEGGCCTLDWIIIKPSFNTSWGIIIIIGRSFGWWRYFATNKLIIARHCVWARIRQHQHQR